MVSIGRSPPPLLLLPFSLSNSNSTSLLSTNNNLHNYTTISYFPFLSPNKTHKPHKTHLSLVLLNPSTTNPLFTFNKRHNGFCVSAQKKPRKGGPTGLMEMDGFDDDGFDDFDDQEDDDDDEDEGMVLPFAKMKKWTENKPRGFGEGKVYDTSIEDKLVEEMEQIRQAQAVNIDKLKNNPVKPGSKKDDQNNKAPEVIPSGICVRLTNLPKKKNIHRDLKSAFEEVRGIINIVPAVSGNKKTKDPICKGFAFVDFKSEEDASRFVQIFSGQSIAFGKIQKQIKYEMMNSHSPNSVDEQATGDTYVVPEPTVPDLEEDPTDSEMDDSSLDLWVETGSDASEDPDDDFDKEKLEDIRKNLESVSVSVQNGGDNMEPATKVQTDSISSNRLEKIRAIEKKLLAKGKVEKVQKLEVPEVQTDSISSNRLERIRALEKKLLAKGKVEKVQKLEVPEVQTDSISSNRLERIRALEKKLLAKGKVEKVRKLEVPDVQTDSISSNRLERIQALEKKLLAKGEKVRKLEVPGKVEKVRKLEVPRKVGKVRKLEVPGSAKRLKIKEKAVLTGVFSKYGVKAASTLKEES